MLKKLSLMGLCLGVLAVVSVPLATPAHAQETGGGNTDPLTQTLDTFFGIFTGETPVGGTQNNTIPQTNSGGGGNTDDPLTQTLDQIFSPFTGGIHNNGGSTQNNTNQQSNTPAPNNTPAIAPQPPTIDRALQAHNAGDYATALREFKTLADAGNADAQFWVGVMYFSGDGVLKNNATAARWFSQAAERGHTPSQFGLGQVYRQVKGVENNLQTAHVWLNIASTTGYQDARVARDEVEANLSLDELNESNRLAQQCIDSSYRNCPNPIEEARKQAEAEAQRLAEAQRQAEAQRRAEEQARRQAEAEARRQREAQEAQKLARAQAQFEQGEEAWNRKDYATALQYYQSAAVAGYILAQYTLGFMYEEGIGVAKDCTTALKWYRQAAAQGNELARQEVQEGCS